jgi:hypothetical protein
LLKFSGVVAPATEGFVDSFFADFGTGLGNAGILGLAPSYPFAVTHDVRNLAVRVITALIGDPTGEITFDLLRNGSPVPGFSLSFFVGGPAGNQLAVAGPVTFGSGDRLDLRARATGISAPVNVSATIGIE